MSGSTVATRVAVTVVCPVPLGDLAPIGLPRTKTLPARAVEPVDVFRSTHDS